MDGERVDVVVNASAFDDAPEQSALGFADTVLEPPSPIVVVRNRSRARAAPGATAGTIALNRTYLGDCRELLPRWAAAGLRAHTCITSPPYFGLRDYGTARWEGGDPNCQHVGTVPRTAAVGGPKQLTNSGSVGVTSGDCACGARRIDPQIGLEPTPQAYVDEIVTVCRAVRDVLCDAGTLWLNLGDSYNAQPVGNNSGGGVQLRDCNRDLSAHADAGRIDKLTASGLPPKNLLGIPWRVALALQADGWYLRSDIIWAKPSPMPESVSDRPTKAHEYLFLLAKSERYYYDAVSIAEPSARVGPTRNFNSPKTTGRAYAAGRAPSGNEKPGAVWIQDGLRNRRSVWWVASEGYDGAHFAVFPTALIEPCIVAGAPPGGIVLDPFMGSGTTAQVATDLGRQFIGCEINAEYVAIQNARQMTVGMAF